MAPVAHTALERFLLLRALSPLNQQPAKTSFEKASKWLKSSEVMRSETSQFGQRFEPEVLKDLYLTLLHDQVLLEASKPNGLSPQKQSSQRKRKVGSPALQSLEEATEYVHLLPGLADRLYSEYKTEAVDAIRQEEATYARLRPSTQSAGQMIASASKQESGRAGSGSSPAKNGALTVQPSTGQNEEQKLMAGASGSQPPTQQPLGQGMSQQTPSAQARLNPPGSGPVPPRDYSSKSPAPYPPPNSTSPNFTPPQNASRPEGVPPQYGPNYAMQYPGRAYGQPPTGSTQRPAQYFYDSRGYPISYPYNQSPNQAYHPHVYQGTPPQVPRGAQYTPTSYLPNSKTPAAGYYHQYQYQAQPPYPQASQQAQGDPQTPLPNSNVQETKKTPPTASASSTKWKDSEPASRSLVARSPTRPTSRDISPISDPGSGTENATRNRPRKSSGLHESVKSVDRKAGDRKTQQTQSSRSVTEEAADRIKSEPSGREDTPSVSSPSDLSGRRPGRRRRGEHVPSLEPEGPRSSAKRKRGADGPESVASRGLSGMANAPSTVEGTPVVRRQRAAQRAGHILVTRNFARIALPLLNEITAHRVANLFAKPLTEREAPGYKDLVYRPQDLKSLRISVGAGGRAANAIMEGMSEDELSAASPSSSHIWLPENEDLRPPRGIVNADQLEKELMRIFANAIMFNPEVEEHRAFGPAFKLRQRRKPVRGGRRKTGGEASPESDEDDTDDDDGAIITDAREVARDVQEAFAAWRAAEREADEDESAAPASSTPSKDINTALEEDSGEEQDDDGERRSKRLRK